MAQTRDRGGASSTGLTVAEIQADIAATRAELGETVEALSAKLDVKQRMRSRVAEVQQQAKTGLRTVQGQAADVASRGRTAVISESGKPEPVVLMVAASLVILTVAVVWRRR